MKAYFNNLPIRIKLVVPMIAALTVMLISVYIYFPNNHKLNLVQAYTREATRTAELFSAAASYALNQHSFELLQKTLQNAQNDANILYIYLLDENDEPLAIYNPQNIPLPNNVFTENSSLAHVSGAIIVKQEILGQEEETLGQLQLGYSLKNLNQIITKVRILTIIFAIFSFLLGFFLINKVSERITRSISELHLQMQAIIDKGSYSSDVRVASNDEVGRLAAAFNKLMEELRSRHQRLVESQERYRALNQILQELNRLKSMFVSDVSHHLRTPLTIIGGEVEVALRKARKPSEYRQTLQIVQEETRHLGKIVGNLLTLAKADTGNLVDLQDAVDFTAICNNQIRKARKLAKHKNILLHHQIEQNCLVRGDPNRLSEAIFNILENAVKYTPKGRTITVTLKGTEKNIVLNVVDTGIGIPENELGKVFSRFYRGGNSSSTTKGSGLGLAICESIVKAHGGEIRVSSTLGKGSTFEVRLKRFVVQSELPAHTQELVLQQP
ncbi:MAG: sensor histidine kinase [bacterium]